MKHKLTIRQHIAVVIERELAFTNGWYVSDDAYAKLCDRAAVKVLRYLRSQGKVARQHRCK